MVGMETVTVTRITTEEIVIEVPAGQTDQEIIAAVEQLWRNDRRWVICDQTVTGVRPV